MPRPPKEILFALAAVLLWMIIPFLYIGSYGYPQRIPEDEPSVAPVIRYLYGIPADSFLIRERYVRPDEMLANILEDLGVSGEQVNQTVTKTSLVFDVRKFKAGNKYISFSTPDTSRRLKYFVYEKDAVNYFVIDLGDTVDVRCGIKQTDTLRQTFAGRIKTSLWNSFEDKGANPFMANELSEIYAWSIDFFGLQQGDSMRVVYDEYFVDSVSIGIGKIHGAWFRHMGTDFWAIPFVQDSMESYFDEKGQSLRKAFLKAPLRFSRISSRFSNSRMHPILKVRRPHQGVDYAAPVGTQVYSIGDGVVVQTGNQGASGNMIKIRHNSVYSTAYLHLRGYAPGIHTGVYVRQGDIIGYVGSTGLSTGPHLDFRFYRNNQPVDPLKVEAPPVEPVKKEYLEAFGVQKLAVFEMIGNF
jgi:murein DD-endopeptidase MepM/ murein hydrolase activator NlpD